MPLRTAARVLGVHENTVRRWVDRGLLAAVRNPSGVRRLRAHDVHRLRASMETPTAAASPPWTVPSLQELMAAQGVEPATVGDLRTDMFASDEELDDFVGAIYAAREES